MKTSRNIITILLLTLFNVASYAQERQLTEEQKEKLKVHLQKSFEKLDLSEEQKPEFKAITKKYALQVKTLRNSNESKSAKYNELKSIISAKNKEMKALLSADQYIVYEATQKERRKKLEYLVKLDLSEEQKPKFEEITKKYGLQMKTLKTSGKSKFAKYNELKSIIGSKNKEMKALLSAEQFKIYKETQREIQKKIKEKRRNRN
ncbi:hypothetical protein [Aquimarina sediminis]|uniref:hypothetical protein n=1 Tax=Aquimarina sediminis TaxID=2070536 RepID=UPI000CA08F86|nr:hypothetical protein [Aquimarina sediminis]